MMRLRAGKHSNVTIRVKCRGVARLLGGCLLAGWLIVLSATAASAQAPSQTTLLDTSGGATVYGQPVVFLATVTGGGPLPTGTVTFVVDGVSAGTVPLNGSAQAIFATPQLSANPGPRIIVATYNGDSNYLQSSNPVAHTVNPAMTSTTLNSSSPNRVFGEPVTFTATVGVVPPGGGPVTGNVTFRIDGAIVATVALNGGGQANFTSSTIPLGAHMAQADYVPTNANFFPSSNTFGLTVDKANTSTTLTSSLNPSGTGQAVTFTATIVAQPPSAAVPTGFVNFTVDGNPVASNVALNGAGQATFTTGVLSQGPHTVVATYNPTPNFNGSNSTTTQNVSNPVATTTTLTSSQNPSTNGQPVTFTATISGAIGTPTGTVTFRDGGTVLGTIAVSGVTASLTTAALATGTHAITAAYSGDAANLASLSPALTQVVNVPVDSQRLRQMQIIATAQSAQLSAQNITGAIDSAIQDGLSDTVQAMTPNGRGFTFNFAADQGTDPRAVTEGADGVKRFVAAPDRAASRAFDDTFAALGYAKAPAKAMPAPIVAPREWLLWLDVRGNSVANNTFGADLRGDQVNVTAGLSRKFTPNFLIGVLGGYEHLGFSSDALNSRLRGDGWTAGAYLGWRIAQSVVFDAAVARTEVGYGATSGLATASFPGSRWLASGGLTGTYNWQQFVVQPSARVFGLWEHDGAYIDSLGTAQGVNNFSTGRASAGAKVSRPFAWTSTVALAPYVGAYCDYYFSSSQAVIAGLPTPAALLQGWSARVTSGVAARFAGGGQISFGGELGGIGSNTNTRVWTWRVQGSLPF